MSVYNIMNHCIKTRETKFQYHFTNTYELPISKEKLNIFWNTGRGPRGGEEKGGGEGKGKGRRDIMWTHKKKLSNPALVKRIETRNKNVISFWSRVCMAEACAATLTRPPYALVASLLRIFN